MDCPSCAAPLSPGASKCPKCGNSIAPPLQQPQTVRLDFHGTPLDLAKYVLLSIVGSLLIIPLAWVSAAVGRWLCRNTTFSDGTTAEFRGTGDQVVVWHVFYVLAVIGQQFAVTSMADQGLAAVIVIVLIAMAIYTQIALTLFQWFCFNVKLSSGPNLQFAGTYPGLFGWYVLCGVSVYTLIGWAWAVAAMYRWMVSHVKGRGVVFEFHASGFEILWRMLATAAASVFIIPIPWVGVWMTRWLIRNITMTRREELDLASL